MSIRFDGNLGIGNIDVRDLIGLSDDEIRERFKESLRGLGEADLSEFMDELKTKLADIEKELHRLQDGFEEELDDAQDSGSIRAEARAELRLKELDEILGELDGMDELAGNVVDHNLRLNRETSENEYFSYNTGGMDDLENGETVTITATGTPNNQAQQGIFGAEDSEAPQQDINDDGVIDANDAAAPDPSDLGQIVFININAGDKISLVSEEGGKTKFKIATADGKVHYLVVKGNATLMFNGSNYANAADLEGWSDALLKRTYENNGSKSFYNFIHADEIAEAGTPVAEAIIPDSISANYASIVAEANALIEEAVGLTPDQTYTLNTALLTPQDQQKLQQMIEALYSSNVINSASTKTLQQAHTEIRNILAGISSDAKRSSLVGALTLLLAKHDYSNFEAFFKSEIQGTAEFYMDWTERTGGTVSDSWNAFEKFIRTIYDPNFLSSIQSNNTQEDTAALNHYSELMVLVGNLEQANAATDNLGALDEAENDPAIPDFFTAANYNILMNKITASDTYTSLLGIMDLGYPDGNQEKARFQRLATELLPNLSLCKNIGEMRVVLNNFFGDGHTLGIGRDNMASIFVRMLKKHHPTLAQFLFSDAEIHSNMEDWIIDGADKPSTEEIGNYAETKRDILIGTETGMAILNGISIATPATEADDVRIDEDEI